MDDLTTPELIGRCAYCGKLFRAKRRDRRLCSASCRVMASRKRHDTSQRETPEQRSEHARKAAAARWGQDDLRNTFK